jgi:hypothetical protein
MTKNRLDNLNDHLFAQIERLCDEGLTPEAIEREARRSIALVALADQTVRNAALQLQAAKILHDHDGRDPTGMLGRFIDQTPIPTGRTLTVVKR